MKRESNYDLLRILSTFSVILLHVSGWFLAYNDAQSPTNCHFVMMQFNHIVRFAVPSFLMLSGAFLLADERNADYKYFYKKSIRNIGLTGAVFCLLYALYRILIVTMGTFVLHRHGTDTVWPRLTLVFYELFTGRPFYHLWYMTTLTGLYLAVPFAIRLAVNLQRGGVDLYGKITPAFLALASVSYFTSEHVLTWDIGWQFCYLSYFLMGYKIRRWAADKKSNLIAALLIMAGCAINILLGVIN